jgi:hypothetical protein
MKPASSQGSGAGLHEIRATIWRQTCRYAPGVLPGNTADVKDAFRQSVVGNRRAVPIPSLGDAQIQQQARMAAPMPQFPPTDCAPPARHQVRIRHRSCTVARIKDDLRAWRLGRCLFVGDGGMYSAENLLEPSRGLGRYILAVPMHKVKEIELDVLSRGGRYRQVADNLHLKEVWVGGSERRRRYILCLNPEEPARERRRRARLLEELPAELARLDTRDDDHPRAACALLASRRYRRYLSTDGRGRSQLDAAKIKEAEQFDSKFVVISNAG